MSLTQGLTLGLTAPLVGGGAPPPPPEDWILFTSLWRDIGVWIDTETWND